MRETSLRQCGFVLAGFWLLLGGAPHTVASAAEGSAAGDLSATYRVDLAGISLGDFRLNAAFQGSNFTMQATGRFSLLAGILYRASGTTASTGTMTKAGPIPSSFTLSYNGGGKKEKRLMSFADGGVRDVTITPAKKPSRKAIPVTEEQLAHVLDPLTAAFLSARANPSRGAADVCRQTLPVFDGKQRYDIILTPKRTERVDGDAPKAVAGPAAVCRAKFMPIAGYRPDHPGIKFMTETDDIEVWLVSVPETPLYLPYRIFVPTAWGRGAVTLTGLKLNLDGRG
jgi:Protein of unknown function (DUF3108)